MQRRSWGVMGRYARPCPAGPRGTATGTGILTKQEFTAHKETVYNLTVERQHKYLVGTGGVWVHNCDYIDALGAHVVDVGHHNWERMFGRKPTLQGFRTMVLDTAKHGTMVGEQDNFGRGISQYNERVVNGFTVWAKMFLDEATNTLRVTNGGIK